MQYARAPAFFLLFFQLAQNLLQLIPGYCSALLVFLSIEGTTSHPVFVVEPRSKDVLPGRSSFFHCKAAGDPPPKITWLKDGQPAEGFVQRLLADGSSRIYILRANEANTGSFRCVATSPQGQIVSAKATLTLRQRRSRPVIVAGPTFVQVKKGETIRLNCKAQGHPNPRYLWFKDGGQLSQSHDRFTVRPRDYL